ncbi:unnamed protein product [Schistosoma mattheei]|uniref:PSI domain-containing protein n=1 Tax=Schistosoma mattheei TaxID=31246 RepID=A0AA85B613_9TREM|nr:unnamed protein product [Schistosoma mattheei]
MIFLIYPNGKISLYYENVPGEIRGDQVTSIINIVIHCETDCPKHKSIITCQDASTSNTRCIWCEQSKMCITSNYMDTHDFKVSGCQIKNSSNISVLSGPTLIEKKETTPTINEADLRNELRQTTENTETHLNSSNISVSSRPTLIEEEEETTPATTLADLRNELRQTTENTETHFVNIRY